MESKQRSFWNRRKKVVIESAKSVAKWLFVTAFSYVYWLAVLLIISMVLMNIWRTSFEEILKYSFILMAITSASYLAVLIYQKVHS